MNKLNFKIYQEKILNCNNISQYYCLQYV